MTVSKEQLVQDVTAYLRQRFLATGAVFSTEMLFADAGIDSIAIVEVVMHMEEEFGIVIPTDELTGDNLQSLDSLADCAIRNQIV